MITLETILHFRKKPMTTIPTQEPTATTITIGFPAKALTTINHPTSATGVASRIKILVRSSFRQLRNRNRTSKNRFRGLHSLQQDRQIIQSPSFGGQVMKIWYFYDRFNRRYDTSSMLPTRRRLETSSQITWQQNKLHVGNLKFSFVQKNIKQSCTYIYSTKSSGFCFNY